MSSCMFHFPIGPIGSSKKTLGSSLFHGSVSPQLIHFQTLFDFEHPSVSGALRSATALGPNLVKASVAAKRYLLWEVF